MTQSLTDDQQKVLANLLVLSYHDGYDSGYDQGSADSLEGGVVMDEEEYFDYDDWDHQESYYEEEYFDYDDRDNIEGYSQ